MDFNAIKRAISASRFESYRLDPTDSNALIFARYQWNIGLSESFYLPLKMLEVTMRNRFNAAFIANFNNTDWLANVPPWFDESGKESVEKARKSIAERGKAVTQDRLVQDLRFGFWTSLLNRRHEDRVFRPMAARLFPGLHPTLRTRNTVSARFEYIRKFRNRIFHYNRICNWPELPDTFEQITEAVKWLDPVAMPLLIPASAKQRLNDILTARPV